MRLVHLAAYDGPYPGSSIPMIRAALRAARERGWEAEAVFAETARDRTWLDGFAEDDLPTRIIERAPARVLKARIADLLAERSDEPTILHTHFTVYDVPAVRAAAQRPGARVLWHLHTPPRTTSLIRIRNRLKFSIYGRGVARILCVAPHLAELVDGQAPRDKALFFQNGIDAALFHPPSDAERRAARATLGLPDGGPVLGHLGWDWHIKGGDRLLEALKELRDGGSDAVAVTRAGPEAARMVESLGLSGSVRVLDHLEDVAQLYAAADAFVSSSRREGMPFAVLEALLSGIPVVASDIPGHVLIASQYPGCHIAGSSPSDFARALKEVLEMDPRESAAQTDAARRAIVASMDLRPWSARLMDLYEDILASG